MVLGYKAGLKSVEERLEFFKKDEFIYLQDIKVLKVEIQMKDITIGELRKKLEKAQKEKDGIQLTVDKHANASKGLNKLIECQIVDNYKKGLGYDNYNVVPPPYIGNFMLPKPDLSYTSLDEFAVKHVVENKSSKEETKAVKKNVDAPVIEEWVLDDEQDNVTQPNIEKKIFRPNIVKKEFVKPRQQEKIARKTVKKVEHNEAVNEEMNDGLVRAATIASSLEVEQDSGNINKTQSKETPNESSFQGTDSGGGLKFQETMRDTIAQTRSENVSKFFNDSLLAGVNTPRSDEDCLKLKELVELCTNLQNRVLDLENTKTIQALEINSLKRRVKKLEKKQRSRTHKLKRLYKVGLTTRVESSNDNEDFGKDASKQGKISNIDADEGMTLVSTYDDEKMFDADQDLGGKEMFVAKQDENVVEKEVDAAQV
nr:hypothetical protein [Tanacetum cinerariifolium]